MRLNLPLLTTVGLLESLWHWTARYCPAGDIGKYSDEAILAGIHWEASLGDPSRVIPTMSSTKLEKRWLDPCKSCRLGVHDWHEHADEAVRKVLQRAGLKFWNGFDPFWRNAAEKRRDAVETPSRLYRANVATTARLPEPEPEPVLIPSPSGSPPVSRSSKLSGNLKGVPVCLQTEGFLEAWGRWKIHRTEIKHKLTPSTEKLQLAKLEKVGPDVAIAMIDQSIEKGWQGLFPPREDESFGTASGSAGGDGSSGSPAQRLKRIKGMGFK